MWQDSKTSEVDQDYISIISERNAQNVDNVIGLNYQSHNELDEFQVVFDSVTICPRNVAKFCIIMVMIVVLVLGMFLPFNSLTATLALKQSTIHPFQASEVTQFLTFGSGETVEASRAVPEYAQNVELTVHGKTEIFNTTATTVRDVLFEKSVQQDYGDGVFPDLNSEVGDNQTIIVDKIVSYTEVDVEIIEYDEQRVEESSLRKGEEVVSQEGVNGERSIVYIVRKIGDNVVGRDEFNSLTVVSPKMRIVKFGTAEIKNNGSIVTVPDTDVKQFALEQIKARGWSDSEFACLVPLWQHESGWRTTAGNQISGAYGIPQALPGSKMATYGDDWRTNPETQIKWGINYIASRYGTPCQAWSSWQVKGWY